MVHSIRRLWVLLPLLASFGVQAMSIGEIDVASHLGEPLRARVPINLDDDVLPGSDCVRLIGPARHHPDLADARVELIGLGGRHFINIRTSTPVNDPMLDITLRTDGCGPSMQKDFVVMLSPKQVEAMMPMPVARPPRAASEDKPASASESGQRSPTTTARKQPARFVLRLDYDDGTFGQIAERIAKRKQNAYRAARAAAGNRRVGSNVSPDANQLLAETKPLPTAPATAVKPATAAQADRPPAGPTIPRPAAPPPAAPVGDRLVLQAPPDNLAPPMAGAPDGQAATPATAESTAAEAEGSGGASASATTQRGLDTGLRGPVADAKPASPWYAWFTESYNLLWLLLLLLLALAIALWLKSRRPHSRFLDKTAPGLHTLLPADPEDPQAHPLLSRNLPPVEEVFAEPPEAKTLLDEALEPRPRPATPIEPMEFRPQVGAQPIPSEGLTVVEARDSFDQVMELAEVMLAFGRSGQAIETLSQHIRSNPRQSVDPWIKLLDLYHQSNLRAEFEALAADLHKHYNVAIIDWNDFASGRETGPLTLESLPHVLNRLTEQWGTPSGLEYLDKLLEDNRGGQRLGFSMAIVRDILLLRDILRQTCLPGH